MNTPVCPSGQCQPPSAHRSFVAAKNPAKEPRPLLDPPEAGSGSRPIGHPEGQGSWPALRQHGHRGKPRALRASVRPGRRAAQGLILSDTVRLSQVQMGCRLGLVDVSAAPPAAHCLWGGLAPCPAVPRGGLCCLRPDPCMSCTLACLDPDSSPTLLGRCSPGTWVCSQQGWVTLGCPEPMVPSGRSQGRVSRSPLLPCTKRALTVTPGHGPQRGGECWPPSSHQSQRNGSHILKASAVFSLKGLFPPFLWGVRTDDTLTPKLSPAPCSARGQPWLARARRVLLTACCSCAF